MEEKTINPADLDLVMRDRDYVLYYKDSPLKTISGNEVAHGNPRLLQAIMTDLFMNPVLVDSRISHYFLFSYQVDFLEKGNDLLLKDAHDVLSRDFLFHFKKTGISHKSLLNIASSDDFYLKDSLFNMVFSGASGLQKALKDYFRVKEDSDQPSDPDDFLLNDYKELHDEAKTSIRCLSEAHDDGIILPLFLVKGIITPSEYVTGLLITDRKKWRLMESPEKSFTSFYREALTVINYIGCSLHNVARQFNTRDLISLGESSDLEFKSTFRWDLRAGKTNPAIEHASLKTISAFLNCNGGYLLIGVRDDGSVEGIESDRFANEDKFLLHFWTLVRTSFGRDVSPYLQTSLHKLDDKTVCVVKCSGSPRPVFLRQPGFDEEFFIRVGPSSNALDISEALRFIADRFPGNEKNQG